MKCPKDDGEGCLLAAAAPEGMDRGAGEMPQALHRRGACQVMAGDTLSKGARKPEALHGIGFSGESSVW